MSPVTGLWVQHHPVLGWVASGKICSVKTLLYYCVDSHGDDPK